MSTDLQSAIIRTHQLPPRAGKGTVERMGPWGLTLVDHIAREGIDVIFTSPQCASCTRAPMKDVTPRGGRA